MNVYSMYGTVYTYIVLASSGRRGASTLKQAHATDSAILPGHAASLKSLDLVLVLPSNTRVSRVASARALHRHPSATYRRSRSRWTPRARSQKRRLLARRPMHGHSSSPPSVICPSVHGPPCFGGPKRSGLSTLMLRPPGLVQVHATDGSSGGGWRGGLGGGGRVAAKTHRAASARPPVPRPMAP